jgi:RND family efflux transporter MFP subunit
MWQKKSNYKHMKQMKYLTLLLPIVPLLYGCGASQAENEAKAEEAARLTPVTPAITQVETIPVRSGSFFLELVSNGRLEAQSKALVPFRVQEQVIEVNVTEGQTVSAGQLLGRVDPFTYKKRLEEAQNRYEQSLIDLEDQLLGHGHSLTDSSTIPPNIFKMARIRSGYNSAITAMAEAERNLNQTSIKAPVGGVVSNLEARENNPSEGFKKFCDILNIRNMNLVFNLLETEIPQVKTGQSVEITPFALPGTSFTGTVTSINPAVDEKGMVRITASIPNPGNTLMDGMNARVLLKQEIPNSLIIPKEAILYRQNRKVVFQYKDNKAIWVYVETGHENSTEVTITGGLELGMDVIYKNNLNLAHESQVTTK